MALSSHPSSALDFKSSVPAFGASSTPAFLRDSSSVGARTVPQVVLVYDQRMLKHSPPVGEEKEKHYEIPERLKAIKNKLDSDGLTKRCDTFFGINAKKEDLELGHTKDHVEFIETVSLKDSPTRKVIAEELDSIYLNEGSSEAASVAAGSVIMVSKLVALGEYRSGAAIVRPPGHHAEPNKAQGFCLYNNVAIAAKCLLKEESLGVRKILIVDWDIHHGNGTQRMFLNENKVLYFSVHRHGEGFYPGGDFGSVEQIGEHEGTGFTINVPLEGKGYYNADYFAIWQNILVPVAKEFKPDMILISAGFDSAKGDPLGECFLTQYGYSVLTKELMGLANGRIVMVLEGGYNLKSTAESFSACVRTLLGDTIRGYTRPPPPPFDETWKIIKQVRKNLSYLWSSLRADIVLEPYMYRQKKVEAVKKRPPKAVKEPLEIGKNPPIAVKKRPPEAVKKPQPEIVKNTPDSVKKRPAEAAKKPLPEIVKYPPESVKKRPPEASKKSFPEIGKKVLPGERTKKKRAKKGVAFKSHIFKVLRLVHPDLGISAKAMAIMNSLIFDIFEDFTEEAFKLARCNKKDTLTYKDIETAIRLVFPHGELATQAISGGAKAVTKFTSS